jgi:ABC-type Zn uptake system ZnuABC Zn-binding protein ZnuA
VQPVKYHSKIIFVLLLIAVSDASATINVFACEPEWAALAEEIGGDKLTIYSATTSMQDPHHIQARPSLIAKARRADLLVCSGAELEIGWLPLLLRKAGNASIQHGQPKNRMYRKNWIAAWVMCMPKVIRTFIPILKISCWSQMRYVSV